MTQKVEDKVMNLSTNNEKKNLQLAVRKEAEC